MTRSGMLAEFGDAGMLLAALRSLRARGYRELDAFTPYPLPAVEEALGLRRSFLNWLVFPAGLLGAVFAFLLQGFLNGELYPLNVGGRPPWALPAFVIVSFETMVLFSGVTGFIALFWLCRLPRLSHPVFAVEGFERASVDRFWLGIAVEDPKFDPELTDQELRELGALQVDFAGGGR